MTSYYNGLPSKRTHSRASSTAATVLQSKQKCQLARRTSPDRRRNNRIRNFLHSVQHLQLLGRLRRNSTEHLDRRGPARSSWRSLLLRAGLQHAGKRRRLRLSASSLRPSARFPIRLVGYFSWATVRSSSRHSSIRQMSRVANLRGTYGWCRQFCCHRHNRYCITYSKKTFLNVLSVSENLLEIIFCSCFGSCQFR